MKKWMWAIPVCLILITSVAIGILNVKDIDPEAMIADVDLKKIAPVSEADALTMIEQEDRFKNSDLEVLAQGEGSRVYVTKGTPEEPEPKAENLKVYTRDLGNGWTYVFEYLCSITFTDQYLDQIERELGEVESVMYYLRDKTLCAEPGSRSKSAYAVEAHITLPSGEEKIAFLDPKTKVLIGFEG